MYIFERLLRLYKVNSHSGKTPLEDFITEILAGILELDQEVLDAFVQEVLLVEGTNFTVSSQRHYSLVDDPNCIIDLVFENEETICFLENKVSSPEGYRQLDRYSTVLANLKQETGKEVFLRYCTKMYDPKTMDKIAFYQFRWQSVYHFMEKQESNELIRGFNELLRSENMAGTSDFHIGDMVVLKGVLETVSKMDEVLDLVKPGFEKNFGEPKERDFARWKQIPKFNRYSIWTTKKVAKHDLEVMVGFEFDHVEDHKAPIIFVQIWCYDGPMKRLIEPVIDQFQYHDNENGLLAWFEEPLTNFLSKENQKEMMVEWFVEKMAEVVRVLGEIEK